MSIKSDAAARAAAEAARRRAIEAAKRAAEAAARAAAKKAAEQAAKKAADAAAKKAAQEAAKKAAQQAAKQALAKSVAGKAGEKPGASAVRQAFGRDELSKGLGRALRDRAASQLGSPLPAPSAPSARTTSLAELRALQAKGGPLPTAASNLRTEVRGDGVANCLERAAALAKPGDQVVLLRDTRDQVGHAVVQRRDGSVQDPNDTSKRYASLADYQRQNPRYTDPVAVKDSHVEAVLTAPPGAKRDALISRLGLDGVAGRRVADGPAPTGSTAPTTAAERAASDAAQVERAWDDAKAAGGNDAQAAQAAAQKLEELTEASSDAAYKNALVQAAAPTLDKVANTLATNARDDGFTSDADKARIKDTVKSLSDVATASGQIGTFLIADTLAQKLPDDAELMHVDDGFYEHLGDDGGPELYGALAARLDYHGKGDAKHGLEDNEHRGWLDKAWDATGGRLVSAAGDVIGAVGDGLGAVVGFAGDVAEGALNVVGDFGEGVVDVAKGTVELAGNAAEWTQDQVMAAAEYAAENGLKLAGEALNWVGDHARELAAEALDIDGQLANLNSPGDSVTLAVGANVGLTSVQAGAEVEMQITRTEDGYEMTRWKR